MAQIAPLTLPWQTLHVLTPEEERELNILEENEKKSAFLGFRKVEWRQGGLLLFSGILSLIAMPNLASLSAYTLVEIKKPLAVLLLCVSGITFLICRVSYYYDSARHIASYREDVWERYRNLRESIELGNLDESPNLKERAANFLINVANEHGFENMFRYGIPLPSQFEEIFLFQISHMSLNNALNFLKTIREAYGAVKEKQFTYHFPHEKSWKCAGGISSSYWIEETLAMPLEEICLNYDIELLAQFRLIPLAPREINELKKIKAEFLEAKQQFMERGGSTLTIYNKKVGPIFVDRDRDMGAIFERFKNNSQQDNLERERQLVIRVRHTLRAQQEEKIGKLEKVEGNAELSYWQSKNSEYKKRVAEIKDEYESRNLELSTKFSAPNRQKLVQKRDLLNRNAKMVQETFQRQIEPYKKSLIEISEPQRLFDEKVDQLARRYDKLRHTLMERNLSMQVRER